MQEPGGGRTVSTATVAVGVRARARLVPRVCVRVCCCCDASAKYRVVVVVVAPCVKKRPAGPSAVCECRRGRARTTVVGVERIARAGGATEAAKKRRNGAQASRGSRETRGGSCVCACSVRVRRTRSRRENDGVDLAARSGSNGTRGRE